MAFKTITQLVSTAPAAALADANGLEVVQGGVSKGAVMSQVKTYMFASLVDISGASAGQIKFPATQNPSANVNTLDDYEEGTYTPGISFGGASVGITYTTALGSYTKIGDRVLFTERIVLSNKGSSVGTALITGRPFANEANIGAVFAICAPSGFTGLTAGLVGQNTVSATTATIRIPNTTGTTSAADTNFSNTSTFNAAGVYQV